MQVLICGGRDFDDADLVDLVLSYLVSTLSISTFIDGAARGADTLGNRWARAHGYGERRLPALWRTEGRSAGPKRNRRMLDVTKPDLVVAFPGGPGTADMIHEARDRGLTVIDVDLDDWKEMIDRLSYQG